MLQQATAIAYSPGGCAIQTAPCISCKHSPVDTEILEVLGAVYGLLAIYWRTLASLGRRITSDQPSSCVQPYAAYATASASTVVGLRNRIGLDIYSITELSENPECFMHSLCGDSAPRAKEANQL